jgi:hypothetical protein
MCFSIMGQDEARDDAPPRDGVNDAAAGEIFFAECFALATARIAPRQWHRSCFSLL